MINLSPLEKDQFFAFKACYDMAKQVQDLIDIPDDTLLKDVKARVDQAKEISQELIKYIEWRLSRYKVSN